MPQPVQRYACDRCHGQKLKCVRQGDGCARCSKAKAICTWSVLSPANTKNGNAYIENAPGSGTESSSTKRRHMNGSTDNENGTHQFSSDKSDWLWPTSSAAGYINPNATCSFNNHNIPALQEHMHTPGYDMLSENDILDPGLALGEAFDLPNLLYPTSEGISNLPVHASTPDLPQNCTPHNLTRSPEISYSQSPETANLRSQDASFVNTLNNSNSIAFQSKPVGLASTALSKVQELSDLNVKLYEHASTIPKPPSTTTEPLSWKGKDFAMDKTFDLSQRMIALLNRISPRYQEPSHSQSLKRKSMCAGSLHHQDSGSNDNSQRDRVSCCLDPGSMLLLLSCYLRLIDTYDSIFGNMQACLDRSSAMLPEDYVSLPSVKVGSFSFPPTSALQITMVLHFASDLLGRLRETTQFLHPPSNDGLRTPESQDRDNEDVPTADISTATLNAVTARQNELVQRIKKLRQSLMALDVI